MPNIQQNYKQYQDRASLGMIGTTMYKDVVSRTNTVDTDDIPFGAACTGVGEDGCRIGVAGIFAGVSVAQAVLDQLGLLDCSANTEQFAQHETVGLLRNGTIWVLADTDAVAAGDIAKWNDDGTIGVNAANDFPGVAIFETDAAAGELSRLRLEA